MTRYVVDLHIQGEVSRRLEDVRHLDELALAKAANDLGEPRFMPDDWIIEKSELVSIQRLERDPNVAYCIRRIRGRRSIPIQAANVAEAKAAALECADRFREDVFINNPVGGWNAKCDPIDVSVDGIRPSRALTPTRASFEVDLADLVAPNLEFGGLTTDQAFETFRWMVATGRNYPGMNEVLSAGRATESISPIRSRSDLNDRFLHAILSKHGGYIAQWRQDHQIRLNSTIRLNVLHVGNDGSDVFRMMDAAAGLTMAVGPNTSHPKAVEIRSLSIAVQSDSHAFILKYGYPGDGSSSWTFGLAKTRGGEPFHDTKERALIRLRQIVPDLDEQISARKGRRRSV